MKLAPIVPMYPYDGVSMANRSELFEAMLDALAEGVVVADVEGRVAFWNRAAEAITGHPGSELIGRPVKSALQALIVARSQVPFAQAHSQTAQGRGSLVHARHRRGHVFPALVKGLVLRDGLGTRIGAGVIFRPLDNYDALPHGEIDGESPAEEDQAEFADRLTALHEDFVRGGAPLSIVWITVDQSKELRGTHGAGACEAMLEKVRRVLSAGLMAAEEIGCWGDDEFLVLSHVRSESMLAAHAQMLGGLARTTDFRWWGDRISISVSIGAAQAEKGETLARLLERAQSAMQESVHAGGNQNTCAHGGKA
jgi:PAS domain S-box-containing protein/diguanylate cyclase (GGDEF)-like protein